MGREVFRIGDKIRLDGDRVKHILAQVHYDEFALIDLRNGNRHSDKITVTGGAYNGLDRETVTKLAGGRKFVRIARGRKL